MFDDTIETDNEVPASTFEGRALASVLAGTVVNGTWYHAETSKEVIKVLEALLFTSRSVTRECVRIWYGDTKTGVAWESENDVYGYVSRSTGKKPCPLLVHPNSQGGMMLEHCIVAIKTKGSWLYKHPTFTFGEWTLKGEPPNDLPEYAAEVYHDGEIYSRHKTVNSAKRLIAFMKGERICR